MAHVKLFSSVLALCLCCFVPLCLLFLSLPASASSNDSQTAFLNWGSADPTNNTFDVTGQPAFILGAGQENGEWNELGWHVSQDAASNGVLSIALDRALISGNPVAGIRFFDFSNSTLYIDLRNENDSVITNLFGNLMTGSSCIVVTNVVLPFTVYTNAVIVDLRRGEGEVLIFDTSLTLSGTNCSSVGSSLVNGLSSVGPLLAEASCSGAASRAESQGGKQPPLQAPSTNSPPDDVKKSIVRKIFFVNCRIGLDSLSGESEVVVGKNGPTKTILKGLERAGDEGSTLIVKAGNYPESVCLAGRNITVRFEGTVNLSSGPAVTPPAVPVENPPPVTITNYVMNVVTNR